MKNIYFLKQIPAFKKILSLSRQNPKKVLIFCDKKLESSFKIWKKDKSISFYFLSSGEEVKSVKRLDQHLRKIISLTRGFNQSELLFIAIGGGSLTDLTGFLASIYKRGVPLIYVPSTYLAALDSAHGGKNALNFDNMKNVIGTYYFPQSTFIIEDVFKSLDKKQKQSAYGELLKIALIEGKKLYQQIKIDKNISLQKYLKKGIAAKLRVVQKDPYELKFKRQRLNLGHTLGHILESSHSLPHGQAVLEGLLFSLEWSFYKKIISQKCFLEIKSLIPRFKKKKIPLVQFKKLLHQDKKYKQRSSIDFIFIKKPGDVISRTVSEQEFLKEARRQGFIK